MTNVTPPGSAAPVFIDPTPVIPGDVPEFEGLPSTPAQLRHAEYVKPGGADSLYMKWQAGEGTEAEWLAERERGRLLYPDES